VAVTGADGSSRVRLQVAAGAAPELHGLGQRARRAVRLAQDVGAPIGPVLRAAADAEQQDRARARAVAIATAQSKFVGRGLVALPIVLVPALDLLLGLPLLGFYGTAGGRAVGSVALVIIGIGAVVTRWLVARVPRPGWRDPVRQDDEATDLLAAAVQAGLPAAAAARAVGQLREELAGMLAQGAMAMEHGRIPDSDTPVGQALLILQMADRVGAPAAPELVELAREQRAREEARVRERAERLPAQLTIPSVLLLLPATVLLLGAPIVASGLAGI
jgi:hypothetical protein